MAKKEKRDIQSMLGALSLYMLVPPSILGIKAGFPPALLLLTVLLCLNFDLKMRNKKGQFFVGLFALLYLYIVYRGIGELSIFGLLAVMVIPFFLLVNDNFLLRLFRQFTNIFAYLLIPSCLVYLLYIAGVPLPHSVIIDDNASTGGVFDVYLGICAVSVEMFPRFCAVFGEPGVVGTITAILLVGNNFKLRPLPLVALVFAGIVSLSLAFFVIVFLYILLYFRSWKLVAASVLIVAIALFFFQELIMTLIVERIVFEEGRFVSNREMGSFNSWYESFRNSGNYLWGLGRGQSLYYNEGGASYKNIIVDYGLVFFVCYVLSLGAYSLVKMRKVQPWLTYLIVMLGILYQRPFIENHIYVFLLLAPIVSIKYYYKNNENRSTFNLPQQKRKNIRVPQLSQ